MRFLKVILTLMVFAVTSHTASAGDTNARFGVYILGLKLGEYHLTGQAGSTSYTTQSRFATTGILAAVADVRFDFSANGSIRSFGPAPQRYSENLNTGRESRASVMTFPTAGPLLDPATALFVALSVRPAAEGCAKNFEIFDGLRTMRLSVRETNRSTTELTCTGTLHRISGYTTAEMAEATGFPVRMQFNNVGGTLVAQTLRTGTIHGTVTMKRR